MVWIFYVTYTNNKTLPYKKEKKTKKKINKNINTSMRTINRNTFIFLHVLSDKHL